MGNTYKQTFNRFELFTFTQPKTLLSIGIFILIGFFTNNVCAQVSAYTFTQSGGTYTPITGGTVFTQTGTVTSPTSLDDNSFNALPIGFSFNYHGNSFTTFGVNANGFITLGGTAASSYDALTVNNESIAALNDDLLGRRFFTGSTTSGNPTVTMTAGSTAGIAVGDVASGTGIAAGSIVTAVTATTVTLSLNATSTGTGRNIRFHNGTIRYETIGTAPNRTLVVQWSNFSRYTTNAAGDFFNFQIRLNECSNTIETVYDLPFINTTTSITTQVGLRGAAGTDFNNRATTTNWSATTAGGTNGATCTLTPTVFPASGTTFTWTPNFVDVSNISINTGTPYCQGSGGSNAIDIFTCSQTSTWTISPTTDLSVTSGTGNGSTVANPNTTTTYTVTSTDGVNSATSTFTVTVTPTPDVTPRNYEICKDATAPTGTIFTSAAITCPAVLPVPNAEITSLGNLISGILTAGTDPTALRLPTSIANSSTCSFDASITRNYQAISFTVSYPGNYTFTMSNNTGADFMGYLVSGAFTPGSCASGTFLRGDDDSEPNGDDPMLSSVALVAGTTYTLITTTWSSTSGTYSGSYTWNVTTTALAPGQVEWYDAASGGTLMGTGLTFNPFAPASGTALTTATAGSTDYFARCTGQTCNDTATVIVKPLATSTQSATACVNYTWSATGTTYTSSGTYTHTFTGGAANGCDSTATLNLTILNPASGTQTTSACVNYTWSATGTTYTSSGTYTHTFTGGAANGCDSTVTLNLTINNSSTGTETATACDTYTWATNGATYTMSGSYPYTIVGGNAAGCDSTVTLNLTINTTPASTTDLSICRGASAAAGLTAMGCNTINGTTSLGNTISGTILTAGTTAVRMISSTNSSTCGYGANVRPYDVQSFTVNLSGNYNFTMSNSGAFDGMAYIYSAPMVIGTCGTGFVRSDDDSEPTGDEPMMTNVPLVAGTTYFLVSTTFDPITADQPFTWTVTGPSSTNTNWFTTATGGVSLANVNMFNPVGVAGSGLANTNTPGVYTYYAACGVNDCRTPASLKIFDVPSITSAVPTCAPNSTITVTSPALNNANHTGADIGVIEYSIDGGAYQASNVFTGVSAGSHTITVRNSANPACASASTNVFVPNTPTTTDAVACQGGGITPIVGLQASGCTGTISASATVNMTFNGTQNNSESNSSATPTTIATGTLNIPAGSTITSVTISVPGTNSDCVNNSYQSEIRFQLSGALVADATSTFSSAGGTGSLAACGAYDYVKTVTTGTTLGTGSTLNLNYWNSFNDNTTGPDATFTSAPVITVLYNAPIVAQWYTASSGGTPIATGNTMNPLITSGSGVTNTNTPGVTTYYTACSGNTICTRTPVNFKVYDKPDITSVTSSAVSCLNETTITVNATIDNANHTGGDIGSIEYSFDNGNSWQPSNTFVGAPNTTYQIRTLNTARPVCFNSSSITTGSALGGPLASTSTCGTCTIADGQGAYTFVNSSGDYIASVSDVAGDGDLGVTNTCVTIDPSPTTLGSSTYLNRHWDIDPTNTSNDGCVTVYFTDAELTALRTASGSTAVDNTAFTSELCISLYHGGAETPGNNTSGEVFSPTGAGAGSVTYTANTPVVGIWSAQFCATSFSGVYCHTCNPIDPSVLPVTLVSFDGKNMGDKNHLYWTTSSELNTSHFEILKSVNGRDFFRIGNNVPAAGNSSTNKDYTLVDNNPRNGHNYYRLKTVDQNGAFQLSNTIDIYLKSKLQVKVQPNPANSFIQVLVNGPEDKLISIEMIDAFGRVVQSKSTAIDRFTTSVNFDLSGLANAVYTIRVTSDVESSETRFIKQ